MENTKKKMCIRDRLGSSVPTRQTIKTTSGFLSSVSYTHLDVYKRQEPGGWVGEPGGKEGQNHVHGDLGVDDVACGAGEFFPETDQAVAGRAQKGSEKEMCIRDRVFPTCIPMTEERRNQLGNDCSK